VHGCGRLKATQQQGLDWQLIGIETYFKLDLLLQAYLVQHVQETLILLDIFINHDLSDLASVEYYTKHLIEKIKV